MTHNPKLSPASEATLLEHTMRETSIALGSVMLSASEMAPRLGCTARGLRAQAEARLIPAVQVGAGYRFHLPTVLASRAKGGAR